MSSRSKLTVVSLADYLAPTKAHPKALYSFCLAECDMNWLVFVTMLLTIQLARPQVKNGTILFINFTPDDLSVAADSRMTLGETGKYDDTECKISAFGNKFVFTMAGGVFADAERNPHLIAR